MLKTIKQRLLAAAKGTRVLEAVAGSEWRRRRLLIIAYHSLAADEEHHWRRPLFFTREEFEQRLALMRQARLNVLSLGEGVERLRAGTLPPRSAVLTFDDGWADFATVVAPLLRRHGLPATVYATTYYSEKRLPIFPLMVSYLLWKGRGRRLGPAPQIGLPAALDLSESSARVTAEETIVDAADRASLAAAEREAWAGRLADLLEVDYADLLRRRVLQLMTPEEMAEVTALGFDVQLHTHRHRVPRVREEFDREIVENRARLETATGRPAKHFCYPSGVYFPEFPGWLTAAGVVTGTTCVPGLAVRNAPSLLLPRLVDTAGLSPVEFEGWLSGMSHVFPRRRGE